MRISFLAALIGICTTFFGGCSREDAASTTSSGKTAIKFALNWKPEPQFGGFYAAKEVGAFEKRGLDVEILPGGSGTPVVQMVAAGQVPFGIASGDEVIIARTRGADVVAIFVAFQTNPQGIMVHASRGMKEIGDVFRDGGTLAMQRGLPYADFLEKKYGFDKVQIVPYLGGIGPFLNDPNFMQQCFVVSEPLAAKKAGSDPQPFLIADAGYNPYTTVVVTRGDYAEQNGAIVKAMAEACRDGWRSYLDDPSAANATMMKLNPSMDAETFAASAEAQRPLIESDVARAQGLGAMQKERWQTLAEQLRDLKVIEQMPPIEECYIPVE